MLWLELAPSVLRAEAAAALMVAGAARSYVIRWEGMPWLTDECGRNWGRVGWRTGAVREPCQDCARWNLRIVWISDARLAT
jgi:hypothetical protein